jgi:hypothetical protein
MAARDVLFEQPPNPRLQRTRGAGFARTSSPLNGKPFGDQKRQSG